MADGTVIKPDLDFVKGSLKERGIPQEMLPVRYVHGGLHVTRTRTPFREKRWYGPSGA